MIDNACVRPMSWWGIRLRSFRGIGTDAYVTECVRVQDLEFMAWETRNQPPPSTVQILTSISIKLETRISMDEIHMHASVVWGIRRRLLGFLDSQSNEAESTINGFDLKYFS